MSHLIVGQDELLKRAGKSNFQRGQAAYTPGRIEGYKRDGNKVTATVEGFQVELTFTGHLVDGHCTCPESEGFDFCRHCVELVLHGNRTAQQLLSLSKGPEKSRVFAYLLGLDKQELAKQMLTLIESDAEIFDRYVLRASLSNQNIDFAALKSRVTELTRVEDKRNLFSHRQVKAFFARIEQLFEEMAIANLEFKPKDAIKLVEYALLRLNRLLDQIGDKWDAHHDAARSLDAMYSRLFPLFEGRLDTVVKRFEKSFYIDRSGVFDLASIDQLQAESCTVDGAKQRLIARAQLAWAHRTFPSLSLPETAPELVSQPWQWYKLASLIVDAETPAYAKEKQYDWQVSLREFVARTPMAWLQWLKDAEADFGGARAVLHARAALKQFSDSEILASHCVGLAFRVGDQDFLQQLAAEQAPSFIEFLSVEPSHITALPDALLIKLYSAVAAINPHNDPEERQYRALSQLLQLMTERYLEPLVTALGKDERLLIDQRIHMAKLLDQNQAYDSAKILREKLVPYLLARKQNRSDDLAAENLVLLRKNYTHLGLNQAHFDTFIAGLDHILYQRSNVSKLIEKYQLQHEDK